ncbi:MAG: hypothetical protein HY447_00725, partial [Candidatus Omnitrophica bacterium]|nr:hypothetical protein [Candidatus Omnitrophota bacterium]
REHLAELESEKNSLNERVSLGEVTEKAIVQEAVKLPSVPIPQAPPSSIVPLPTDTRIQADTPTPPSPSPKTPPASPPVVDQRPTQVLSVNRQFNFVVVNMGLRDRLKIGDQLRIEENGKLIGRVQVEKLYENFSACTILEEIKPAKIQEGNLVRIG